MVHFPRPGAEHKRVEDESGRQNGESPTAVKLASSQRERHGLWSLPYSSPVASQLILCLSPGPACRYLGTNL